MPIITIKPFDWTRDCVRHITIAHWFITKGRRRAREVGYYAAAVQLRKQGVPLSIARLILLGV